DYIGYKSNIEVAKEYIRKLSRLAGLLEIGDDEFKTIRDEINDYRNKIGSLVSKGNFKDISLNIDSYSDYLKLDPYRDLIKHIASINHADVEDVNYERFYDDLVAIGFTSLSEVEQMRIDNSKEAYKLALLQLSGTDIDIISSTIAMQNLITIYLVKKGVSKETFANLFVKSSGKQHSVSDAYIDKLMEQARGIINI
ncbi:MAG: hypothetical protein MJ151_04250, partial [Lachnospiraceae bacterium]|nr:hypothetical protein [Lachnospiraceae bacterium]